MEFIDKITTYLISLNEKNFSKYCVIIISTITLTFACLIYYIHARSSYYVKEIKQLQQVAEKAASIIASNDQIQKEEDRIQDLLNKNKDFDIKRYFEQFCKEYHISAEPNWSTTTNPIEGNDKFEEVILTATFKNETTQTLVSILDALDKNEIVYLTELKIKKEKDKIAFDITIATIKQRRILEE